jgi:DNA-binding transcriptional LysR family regulator
LELSVSHSVISHHLNTLQQQLHVKLIRARGRGIELTTEGMLFQDQITRSFDIIARATSGLAGGVADRTLTIWCGPGLAERRLIPSLPELEVKLQGVEIVLCPTTLRPNLAVGEADLEIVALNHMTSDPQVSAELLLRPRVFPVASPAFLARYPEASTIDSLARLPLLHEDSTKQWERWLGAAHAGSFEPLSGMRLWNDQMTIQAARLGQGIALSNDALVSEDLAAGHLVEPIRSNVRLWSYYVLTKSSRSRDPDIVAAREWLQHVCLRTQQSA